MSVHFMSQSVDWATPEWLYAELDKEFGFDFDPCPLYGASSGVDGLTIPWGQSTFVNPPYGRAIGHWTAKAKKEAGGGKTVVMLIPSRTDTKWWHEDIMTADEIRFIKGRLKFGGAKTSAPFPSAVIVWNKTKGEPND
jgi:site-specific DNA-methyltransferase (adenine-specific)